MNDTRHTVGESLPLFPPVLDACCGSRMFWFDRADPRALFIDKRQGEWPIDIGTPGTVGRTPIVVAPDVLADFSAMPFADETFSLVVFDPPHVQRQEARGALTRRYGVLNGEWREMLRKGFAECLRVLKPNGVLVFKWGESQFKVADIVKLAPVKPLFGHHTSKTTHWAVFIKDPLSDETDLAGGGK
jgi:SAM-dependent methyltransferase